MSTADATPTFMTAEAFRAHWQGHRRLTRKLIEAFPDDQLFTFSLGGMRTFGALAMELLSMAAPMMRGVVTGEWNQSWNREPQPKEAILKEWDESTAEIDALWAKVPDGDFARETVAFGQFPGKLHDLLLYVVDNEVHHRGQGYVYLRALGIEPPHFWER